jgi:hypothetical protein
MAEKEETNFVIEEKRRIDGVRYYCVYNSNKSRLLLITRSMKVIRNLING